MDVDIIHSDSNERMFITLRRGTIECHKLFSEASDAWFICDRLVLHISCKRQGKGYKTRNDITICCPFAPVIDKIVFLLMHSRMLTSTCLQNRGKG